LINYIALSDARPTGGYIQKKTYKALAAIRPPSSGRMRVAVD